MEEKNYETMTIEEMKARIKELEHEKEILRLRLKTKSKTVKSMLLDIAENDSWLEYAANTNLFTTAIATIVRYSIFGTRVVSHFNEDVRKMLYCEKITRSFTDSDAETYFNGIKEVVKVLNKLRGEEVSEPKHYYPYDDNARIKMEEDE